MTATERPPKAGRKTVKKGGRPVKTVKVPPSGQDKITAALIKKILIGGLLVALFFVALVLYEWRRNATQVRDVPKKEDVRPEVAGPKKQDVIAKGNIPPEFVAIKLTPSNPVKGDEIKAEVFTRDTDNDHVTLSYKWTKNGKLLPGNDSDTLSADFKKGDTVSVTVTPFDGKEEGAPATVFTNIFNSPPVITSSVIKDAALKDVLTYQVKAEDPDDDPLSYSMISVPEAMEIDPKTGLIKWSIPEGFKGKVSAIVTVKDDAGGEARQVFNVQVGKM